MASVFINYRTGDEHGTAALLQVKLSARLGDSDVFLAPLSIAAGDDFEQSLLRAVRGAKVMLSVIGQGWLTAERAGGGRALDAADDWVRREIALAFACGVRVIPVLVNDTERLTGVDLPADIEPLTRCQSIRLRHDSFDSDLRVVVERTVKAVRPVRARLLWPAVAAVMVVLAALGLFLVLRDEPPTPNPGERTASTRPDLLTLHEGDRVEFTEPTTAGAGIEPYHLELDWAASPYGPMLAAGHLVEMGPLSGDVASRRTCDADVAGNRKHSILPQFLDRGRTVCVRLDDGRLVALRVERYPETRDDPLVLTYAILN